MFVVEIHKLRGNEFRGPFETIEEAHEFEREMTRLWGFAIVRTIKPVKKSRESTNVSD